MISTTTIRTSRKTTSSRKSARQPSRSPERELPEAAGLQHALGLQLVDRLRVDARAEVLPAVVGRDEHHVALVELARDASGDRRDRSARHPEEQALLLKQLLGPHDRVAVGHEDLAI